MSFFDEQCILIRPNDIKMMLYHNDIEATFNACPCEANIRLADITAVSLSASDIHSIDMTSDSVESDLIKMTANKINDIDSYVREDIISEIRTLNSTTVQIINSFREDAYIKLSNDMSSSVSREGFLSNQYQDESVMAKYIGESNYKYLKRIDPVIDSEKKTFAFDKDSILIKMSESVQEFLSKAIDKSSEEDYDMAIGLMIAEYTGRSPEEVIKDYHSRGSIALECETENIDFGVLKRIDDLYYKVDFDRLVNNSPGRVNNAKTLYDGNAVHNPGDIKKALKDLELV